MDRFANRIVKLIVDPDFVRLNEISDQPNFFKAVGRGFTETWHSMFLGWLLDPQGAHGLGGFPIKRFLVAIANCAIPATHGPADTWCLSQEELAVTAVKRDFSSTLVLPNERDAKEKSSADGSKRFDVWIEDSGNKDEPIEGSPGFVCVVEHKVKADLTRTQASSYPDFLRSVTVNGKPCKGICVFIGPRWWNPDLTSVDITGDERWYCMDYQVLHDALLEPCLQHPRLNSDVEPFIRHYIRNLRTPVNGEPLAMSKEERDLAQELISRYKEPLKTLATLLAQDPENPDDSLLDAMEPETTGKSTIVLELDDNLEISGGSIRELYRNILDYLNHAGRLAGLPIPYSAGGRTRYLINDNPVHANGRSFIGKPMEYLFEARLLYVDIWASRAEGITRALRLLEDCRVPGRLKEP